jgi:predicted Zn-dependent protease with MMP-like domain
MDHAEFEEHVRRALESLPAQLRAAMQNVEIVVEDENREDPDLFGLYHGIPLTDRGEGYAGALPDKISVYRLPLEEEFGDDPAVLEEEIRITVLHELAHHFGIDEDRLTELGWN